VHKFNQREETKCKVLNSSSTEFELNSTGYVFSAELFIFPIAEYCVIPEELMADNRLEVIYFGKFSRCIYSSCHIKFILFTVYQSIFKSL